MAYKREDINGTSPLDIKKLNDNLRNVWNKVFGDINFSDADNDLKSKILTQWIPVQGEGNFDKNFPLTIRFFVPNNTKKIVSTNFNLMCERYRMDSGVAEGGGAIENVDITMSMGSTTVSGSVSNGGDTSSYAKSWGNWNPNDPYDASYDVVSVPATYRLFNDVAQGNNTGNSFNIKDYAPYGIFNSYGTTYRFAPVYMGFEGSIKGNWVDLATLQHKHEIPPHGHSFSAQPHGHTATGKVTLEDHSHPLKEGIKISTQEAQGVEVSINGIKFASMNSSSVPVINNLDITDKIKIGEWNVIQCTTINLARIVLYGTIELISKS